MSNRIPVVGPDDILTRLPDLADVPFGALRDTDLDPYTAEVLEQVQRPRVNLGGGPPGRAD